MKHLECRYVAHITTVTNKRKESLQTSAANVGELIDELENRYPGFAELFRDPQTGGVGLQAMVYYTDEGEVPTTVIDLAHPIHDRGTATFW
jgi:molybdopterin converting factor small subunit